VIISSREIGMRRTARLGVLVALAALAGCGGGDSSSTATKSPASASTAKPAAKPAAPGAKDAAKPAAAQPAAQDAAAVDPEVAAALKDVQLPTQAEADAAAAQEITDANADAEFEKLQKELGGAAEAPK
jgi:hypothetical protein